MAVQKKELDGGSYGDIAEACIASAIALKYIKKGAKITWKETIEFAREVIKKEKITKNVRDANGKTIDNVTCFIKIPTETVKNIINYQKYLKLPDYENVLYEAVRYANTDSLVTKESSSYARNGEPDVIEVRAAGTEDQSGTKIDVFVEINGKRNNGQLSLKVDSPRLANFDRGSPFDFDRHIGGLFTELLELPVPKIKEEYMRQTKIYEQIAERYTFPERDRDDKRLAPGIRALKDGLNLVIKEAISEINKALKKDYKMKLIKKIVYAATKNENLSILDLKTGAKYQYGKKFEGLVKALDFKATKKAGGTGADNIIITANGSDFLVIRPTVQTNISKSTFKVKPRVIWFLEAKPTLKKLAKIN